MRVGEVELGAIELRLRLHDRRMLHRIDRRIATEIRHGAGDLLLSGGYGLLSGVARMNGTVDL